MTVHNEIGVVTALSPSPPSSQMPVLPLPTFTEIRKRDGRQAPFDAGKITAAIAKAGNATGEFDETVARRLSTRVILLARDVMGYDTPSVEGIQDLVEDVLLASPFRKTAKANIYRDQRARVRELTRKADLDLIDNPPRQAGLAGQREQQHGLLAPGSQQLYIGEISKTYWLNKLYPAEVKEAHESGALHLHDLAPSRPIASGWDLQDSLRSGFQGSRQS